MAGRIIVTGKTGSRSGSASFDISMQGGFINLSGSWVPFFVSAVSLDVYGAGSNPSNGATVAFGSGLISMTAQGNYNSFSPTGSPWATGNMSFAGHSVSILLADGATPGLGSCSWSFDVEEVIEVDDGSNVAAWPNPFGGETCVSPSIMFAAVRLRLGGSWSTSFSIGGVTKTLSGTITSGMAATYISSQNSPDTSGNSEHIQLWAKVNGYTGIHSVHVVGTTFLTGSADGVPFGAPYSYNSGSIASTVVTMDYASGISMTYDTIGGTFGIDVSTTGFVSYNASLTHIHPMAIDVTGHALDTVGGDTPVPLKGLCMATNYGSDPHIPLQTFTLNPACSLTVASSSGYTVYHNTWDSPGVFNFHGPGSPPVQYYKKWYPGFQLGLDSSDATTAKESQITGTVYDSRLLMRFPIVAGPKLSVQNRITIDPCTSLTSPGFWSGVTLVSGHFEIDTSTSTNAFGNYSTSDPVLTQGRYLALNIVDPNGGTTLTVTIVTLWRTITFTVITGAAGVATDVLIDTCAPNGLGHLVDPTDSNINPTSPYFESPMFGVRYLKSINIAFPSGTGVYEIHELAVKLLTPPVISTMCANSAFTDWNGPPGYQHFFGIVVDNDGRRALEVPAYNFNDPGPGNFIFRKFSYIPTVLPPGWAYTAGSSSIWYSDPYISFLGGGGALVNAAGVVTPWIRQTWSQTLSIDWQGMFDAIIGYPNMGDFWGANTGNFKATFLKILRGTFNGIVVNLSTGPIIGTSVTSKEGTTTTGSGTTDFIGRYTLGRIGSLNTGDVVKAGADSITQAIGMRQDWRIAFSTSVPTLGKPHIASDKRGLVYVSYIATDGLGVWRSDLGAISDFINIFSSVPDDAQIAVRSDGSLVICFELASTVYIIRSIDSGNTWDSPVTLASGTNPCIDSDLKTGLDFVALHDGTSWQFYRQDMTGNLVFVSTICSVHNGEAGITKKQSTVEEYVFTVSDVASGNIQIYESLTGDVWSGPTVVAHGDSPGIDSDLKTGFDVMDLYDGSQWQFFRQDDTGAFVPVAPICSAPGGEAGLTIRQSGFRELVFVVGDPAYSNLRRFISLNGQVWDEA